MGGARGVQAMEGRGHGAHLPGAASSGVRMSQRKMASPTLRAHFWSGVKATARTGAEWPMNTYRCSDLQGSELGEARPSGIPRHVRHRPDPP